MAVFKRMSSISIFTFAILSYGNLIGMECDSICFKKELEINLFYEIDTIKNDSVIHNGNAYYYKCNSELNLYEKHSYVIAMTIHFEKQILELEKLIELGKHGPENIRVIFNKNDPRSSNVIYLSLYSPKEVFNKKNAVLIKIRGKTHILKVVFPI